jgi:ACT domain-containing protein
MRSTKYYCTIIFIGLLILSCQNKRKSNASNDGLVEINDFVIKKGENLSAKEWNCHDIQFDRICYPISWSIVNQQERLLATTINDIDSNSFFTVVRYDLVANNINIKSYLMSIYSQSYYDSIEPLDLYSFKQLNFKDKVSFYGEFNTHIESKKYIMFVMILNFNGILYDIGLKTLSSEKEKYYHIFQNILYNYRANGKPLFSETDDLISYKEIDLSNPNNLDESQSGIHH